MKKTKDNKKYTYNEFVKTFFPNYKEEIPLGASPTEVSEKISQDAIMSIKRSLRVEENARVRRQ